MSPAASSEKKRKAAELDTDEQNGQREVPTSKRRPPLVIQIGQRAEKVGHLLGCGQNEVGQLGLGEDVTEKSRPAIIVNVSDKKVVATSAGGMHSLFLTDAGDVWSFGCNDEGALGRDTTDEGSEYETRKIDLPGDCISITAGDSHSAFLLSDGRVFACGSFRDSHGTMGLSVKGKQQVPVEVVSREKFVDIKSGADHLVMLSNKGRVYTVGCGEQGQLGRVSMRSSSGESRRGKTQLLEPTIIKSPKFGFVDAIWATTYCTFVRNRVSGAIFGFGLNNYHQLGVAKSGADAIFAPVLTTFENVRDITGGQHHTLVLSNENKPFAIGRKEYGRLGLGEVNDDVVSELRPINALGKLEIVQLECGESCSFAVTADGKVYSWGMGATQLGIGSDDDQLKPVQLAGVQVKDRHVVSVSSGGQHTLIVAADQDAE